MKRTTDEYRKALCSAIEQRGSIIASGDARPIPGSWTWNALMSHSPRSKPAAARQAWIQNGIAI
jgi:hypothetical protein